MIIVVHFILFASVLRRVAIKRILTCLANFFLWALCLFLRKWRMMLASSRPSGQVMEEDLR